MSNESLSSNSSSKYSEDISLGTSINSDSDMSNYSIGNLSVANDYARLKRIVGVTAEKIFDPTCIRDKINWSSSNNKYKFDNEEYDKEYFLNNIKDKSPKLDALLKNIEKLDADDMTKYGHKFKHFIFSDVKKGSYGAKMIASAFIAKGMTLGYTAQLKPQVKTKKTTGEEGEETRTASAPTPAASPLTPIATPTPSPPTTPTAPLPLTPIAPPPTLATPIVPPLTATVLNENETEITGGAAKYMKIELIKDEDLMANAGNNFFLLSSIGVYDQAISVTMKKSILSTFNRRPDNAYGDLARIIIMDSGFKEGIDLFDIKYVHIYEPALNAADQRQVIGRGTRTCGQKGLLFHPTRGWPLYVFNYDIMFQEKFQPLFNNSRTSFELYMKTVGIDMRIVNFTEELERVSIYGSVDYELNKNIHEFTVSDTGSDITGGAKLNVRRDLPPIIVTTNAQGSPLLQPPINFDNMRKYVREQFGHFEWKNITMENNCGYDGPEKAVTGGASTVKLTPTQDFIRHYFTPQNPLKGMLLQHSVGTGKTCCAIATATTTFEPQGYTILWVTRTTLKNDIWKNMFDQICHERLRIEVENGMVMPDKQAQRLKALSKSWSIRPMSYKQFSNMVSKKNNFYKALIKKNGEIDPLRKTLLIIDEAHKLYGGGDLSSIERPDMSALHSTIMNSYMVSGINSVKLLLMTATPITVDPMELIKLVNLFKTPDEQMPVTFDAFSHDYLDENGRFTKEGNARFLDNIAGHISYLNREKDARQFSQPIIKNVLVNIADARTQKMIDMYDKKGVAEIMNSNVLSLRKQIVDAENSIDDELKEISAASFKSLKSVCNNEDPALEKKCIKTVNARIRELVKEAKGEVKEIRDIIKQLRNTIKTTDLMKKKNIAEIISNIENNPLKYELYKKSLYSTIKDGCSQQVRDLSEYTHAIREHPAVILVNNELKEKDDEIEALKANLKMKLVGYKNRIAHINQLMKTDLSDLEKSTLRIVLREERKNMTRSSRLEKANTQTEINNVKKNMQSITKRKRKIMSSLNKSMRVHLKEHKSRERETLKEERALRRTLRKQSNVVEDFNNTYIKDLMEKYSVLIQKDLEDLKQDISEREQQKQAAKEAKKLAVEQARLAKKAIIEQTKLERKAAANAAKEATKQMKRIAAQEAKEAKKLAKKK
jgi:hypothetical protein